MIPQLSVFMSDRMLVVHQEPLIEALPEDQKNQVLDNLLTLLEYREDFQYDIVGFLLGSEIHGVNVRTQVNSLGESFTKGEDLPLFVFDLNKDDMAHIDWEMALYENQDSIISSKDLAFARCKATKVA
jgi:hypothetical protein